MMITPGNPGVYDDHWASLGTPVPPWDPLSVAEYTPGIPGWGPMASLGVTQGTQGSLGGGLRRRIPGGLLASLWSSTPRSRRTMIRHKQNEIYDRYSLRLCTSTLIETMETQVHTIRLQEVRNHAPVVQPPWWWPTFVPVH